MHNFFYREESGQTLIEILIAVVIVVLVLVAVVSRVVDAVGSTNFARNQLLATRFAQEGIEWARSQRDGLGWFAFANEVSSDPTFCLPNLDDSITALAAGTCSAGQTISLTLFEREISFDYRSVGIPDEGDYVDVSVTVSWEDRVGTHQSLLNTRLSRWSRQG